jgi:L-lysine 6-transaminase
MASFVETFVRVLGDPVLPHLFYVDGGALAVENALKVAFDWKSRHNEARGIDPALGTRVLHLTGAFHGRSGYALSLTNTDATKTARFPKFSWPRIDAPFIRPDLDDDGMASAEAETLRQARSAFAAHPHDIACFIAEPIQGEGGDRHFRPNFFAAMRELCDEFDALFVADEVQTGCGITGTAWAYQQLGSQPDVVAFGKKTQICGIMAGRRVDEVPDNVFAVSSRINSTFGGNLVDMVRARRILEVIEADDLLGNAAMVGGYLKASLDALAAELPAVVRDVRGRGLMCAFSLPSTAQRDALLAALWNRGVIALGCGPDSLRFRPALTVSRLEIDCAVAAVREALLAAV